MVQWPGTEPCEGNTWLYDCAQFMNMNALANSVTGQAMDATSAMAAAQALKAAEEAKAAAQQQQQGGGAAAAASTTAGTAAATVIPGLGAISTTSVPAAAPAPAPIDSSSSPGTSFQGVGPTGGSTGVNGASGPNPMPAASLKGGAPTQGDKPVIEIERQCMPEPCGGGMGSQDAGSPFKDIGGMMSGGGRPATVGTSLIGTNSLGRRHVMQFGGGQALPLGSASASIAGGAGGAGGSADAVLAGRMPIGGSNSAMGPACQKPIQGLVTGANLGIMVIPNFKGVASFTTRGNDMLLIQLGGSNSRCVAGYQLMAGQVLDVGRNTTGPPKQQAARSSGAAGMPAGVFMWGALVLVMQLLQHL